MKERPILFNGEMVRAILEGRKIQTRRMVADWQEPGRTADPNNQFPEHAWISLVQKGKWGFAAFGATEDDCMQELLKYNGCPHGKIGDRLWVRETFSINSIRHGWGKCPTQKPANIGHDDFLIYRADGEYADQFEQLDGDCPPWRPSIHMPRWASRITLEITNVRVERLNSIPAQDPFAEGVYKNEWGYDWKTVSGKDKVLGSPQMAFANLWNFTGGDWAQNPWVWVIEFKVVKQ